MDWLKTEIKVLFASDDFECFHSTVSNVKKTDSEMTGR